MEAWDLFAGRLTAAGRTFMVLLAIGLFGLVSSCVPPAGRTFVVDHFGDLLGDVDGDPGDGKCATQMDAADCSLRAAIEEANALPGADRIEFDLDVTEIDVIPPLPVITESLVIDGTTQPGYVDTPLVNIHATAQNPCPNNFACPAFEIASGTDVTLRALRIEYVMGNNTAVMNYGQLTLDRMDLFGNHWHLISEGAAGTVEVTISDSIFESSYETAIRTTNTNLTIQRSTIRDGERRGIHMQGGALSLTETVIEGYGKNNPPQGGGIYLEDSIQADLLQCAVRDNYSPGAGGGLYFEGASGAMLEITDSSISGNEAEDGGGVYIETGIAHVSNGALTGNRARNNGGGIYAAGRGTELYVENGTLVGGQNAGNTADSDNNGVGLGGGIYSMSILAVNGSTVSENAGDGIYNAGGTLRMQNGSVLHNSRSGIVSDGQGAVSGVDILTSAVSRNALSGIDAKATDLRITGSALEGNGESGIRIETGSLDVSGSTIADNRSSSFGGGIFLKDYVSAVVQATTVSGNQASVSGGGIYILDSVLGTSLQLLNVTISGNRATVGGGGVEAAGGAVAMNSVTLADNAAGSIGGLHSAASVLVTNSILADNAGGNCGGPITSGGHNLDTLADCAFAGPGDLAGMPANLGPLENNGGATLTHALLTGSPALEAGNDATCLPTDQRGANRPQGLHCDMGAFEAKSPITATPPITPTTTETAIQMTTVAPTQGEPQPTATPTRESPPQPTATPTRENPPTRTSTPRPTREPPQPTPSPTRR